MMAATDITQVIIVYADRAHLNGTLIYIYVTLIISSTPVSIALWIPYRDTVPDVASLSRNALIE